MPAVRATIEHEQDESVAVRDESLRDPSGSDSILPPVSPLLRVMPVRRGWSEIFDSAEEELNSLFWPRIVGDPL